jgi:prepilin-type N-terminal cleavage/methylation domain-containing protein
MSILRRFTREDEGFSLVELLAAMAAGSFVLTAVMYVFTTGLTAAGRVEDRIDSGQRARLTMDKITTLLDAQVCLVNSDETASQVATPPIVTGATGSSVTFYADLNGASDTPNRYTINYDATAKTLTLLTYKGTGVLPSVTFATTPVTTRLMDNVQAYGSEPVFKYYSFTTAGLVDEGVPLTTPLSADSALKTVRVGVKFQTYSTRTKKDDPRRTVIVGEGTVATADPTDQTTCP